MDQSTQSAAGQVFSANPGPVIPNEEVQQEMAAQAQSFDAARKQAQAAAGEKANQATQKQSDKKDTKESKSD
ncbi:hypothetical protein TWF106_010883 [Orbilia oligospora]|uniref:Uncharacterized protein n=1 Tax=Orbilia oligospora TaxID=2813651 RepID=A0A6G1M7S6_ORBOL|nr:hypothetical protein TWF788_010470 [Orbilia oligospora]KAF3199425.1 hypothetical protein TWF679_001378 [Orbilia oligospora]KAF3209648.1 hypothetical protein TWF106_010883 [Orbilia oligospora]KAF3221216.1 hypothetical protein TWF191_007183 [Orbilia oligospora]KAF3246146.1 hypothetical protein TWF192_006993 [Orbilia oligospora]